MNDNILLLIFMLYFFETIPLNCNCMQILIDLRIFQDFC